MIIFVIIHHVAYRVDHWRTYKVGNLPALKARQVMASAGGPHAGVSERLNTHLMPVSSPQLVPPSPQLKLDKAVKVAEGRFREIWYRLSRQDRTGIDGLYVSLLGTPILGELVGDFDLVLNESVCASFKSPQLLNYFLTMQDRESRVSILLFVFPQKKLYTTKQLQ